MRFRPLALVILIFTAISVSKAGPITAIYSFGDSLSDTGNDYLATGGTLPGAPYYSGRFSNGPIWIDRLSAVLGLPVNPSLALGTNYAYGGAETGNTPVHTATQIDVLGATGQIAQFSAAHATADPNALYTIWIGSNDLADVLSSNPGSAQLQTDLVAIAGNVDTAIANLAAKGAKNFLVVTVPDLGKTPAAIVGGPLAVAASSSVSFAFDSLLVNGGGQLPSLATIAAGTGLSIKVLDTYSLLDAIVANSASYGFNSAFNSAPCLPNAVNFAGGTPCSTNTATQNQYIFWDYKHPTSAAHAIVGQAAAAIILAPEPSTAVMLLSAFVGLGIIRRRTR